MGLDYALQEKKKISFSETISLLFHIFCNPTVYFASCFAVLYQKSSCCFLLQNRSVHKLFFKLN